MEPAVAYKIAVNCFAEMADRFSNVDTLQYDEPELYAEIITALEDHVRKALKEVI